MNSNEMKYSKCSMPDNDDKDDSAIEKTLQLWNRFPDWQLDFFLHPTKNR